MGRVLDTTGFAVGNTISISSITTMLFQILSIVPGTRRLDADGRRLTGTGGQFGITPALPQQVNVNDQVFVSGVTVTTTTEMPWGFPWWGWLLLCCGLCCCLSLCCGGPLGVLPMLGGKKKPTKKPAPAPQPTVVEEVVTVEDEVPLTGGYGTGVPMASMAANGIGVSAHGLRRIPRHYRLPHGVLRMPVQLRQQDPRNLLRAYEECSDKVLLDHSHRRLLSKAAGFDQVPQFTSRWYSMCLVEVVFVQSGTQIRPKDS